MLQHGGKIQQAALKFGMPPEQWLDLSTGINPLGWKVPPIPDSHWLRLPEDEDGLVEAASSYYGVGNLLPVAGSQAAIQVLSRLTENSRVAVLSPTYSEHAHAWGFVYKKQKKRVYYNPPRHRVEAVSLRVLENTIELYDVVIVVNPNNPTGQVLTKERLSDWRKRLAVASQAKGRERWLVVDEAFMDSTPEDSIVSQTGEPGLIVLRSLGKFFGLAGVRVGFMFGWPELLESASQLLGPWQITGPSRLVARQALLDRQWQDETRKQLLLRGERLHDLLGSNGLHSSGGTSLFQWMKVPRSKELFNNFAKHGVLIRHFSNPGGIRFGLPGTEPEWQRLENTLSTISEG